MTIKKSQNRLTIIVFLLILSGIAACTTGTPTVETPPLVESGITPTLPEETALSPTSTPTPDLPVVMLVYGAEADSWTVNRLQVVLEELVTDSSLGLVVQEEQPGDPLLQNAQIVVGVRLAGDPAGLAAANPGKSFVFIDQPGAAPAGGVSVVGDPNIDQQRQSFMAGYLAALVSSDYKVAGMIPADQPLTPVMADAFVVGAEFFCGVCNPLYPPFQNFPQWELLPVENAADGFQPVVETFIVNGVEVLYVQGQLASPALLTYLADQNIKVVGDAAPDTIRNNWVGTIATDPGPALIELWPDLLQGTGGVQVPSAITLTDTESRLVSQGRLRVFEEMAEKLESGLVSPLTNP